jgi:hypothetical protein
MRIDQDKVLAEVGRPLVGKRPRQELLDYLAERLPRLEGAPSAADWRRRATAVRREMLELFFRGHPAGLLRAKYPVEWLGTARSGDGYRVRKVRFEGYPGLWVPALLYEPWPAGRLPGRFAAILNPNGHWDGGKAMEHKQARCINLAKRGALALSYEFLGMGELSDSKRHNRIGHLDLVGVAGIGVFYLAMKRALDVLLAHPRVDRKRVAMTGISGGGWQTILLSSLDERVTASIPVAGHSAVWQRIRYRQDIGDLEQVPTDLCAVADYDVLSGMLAPRPSLFIYNHDDDCCFQTRRARVSVIEPARRIFDILGAGDLVETHDNLDPGTHNYERDNRGRLYAFVDRRLGVPGPAQDLPWEDEVLTEEQCTVGLPAGNATLLSLATARADSLVRSHAALRSKPSTPAGAKAARKDLASILRLPRSSVTGSLQVSARVAGKVAVERSVLTIDRRWSVPLVRAHPPVSGAASAARRGAEGAAALFFEGGETVLAVSDWGRQDALRCVMRRCCGARPAPAPAHVLAADVFGTGELARNWQELMVVAGSGDRPLGIQVAQILALARWARSEYGRPKVSLHAAGTVVPVAGLIAVALEPGLFGDLVTESLLSSFKRLMDYPLDYEQAAPLFCFGLLARFDIPDLVRLCGAVEVRDPSRGRLQPLGGRR